VLVTLVPPAVVTVRSTVPAVPAGAVAVIWVALFTVKVVALVPPNWTAVAPVKFVPVIVTAVPPVVVPLVGVIPVMVGAEATYVNRSAGPVGVVVPPAVTVISTNPAEPGGEIAVIRVEDTWL
jgi:hypothetical protein